ncbi:hypothetical protein HHK36_025956 [Tetracentron sinense]|uniref:poly(A)-specific ribonuclease n=1 Tax=Tetracentron sinense TaxID=13715 RepID=A0A835D3M2_TETSI|nr:hypothetical protein HHK36_025956 [Tetracentron sinense]
MDFYATGGQTKRWDVFINHRGIDTKRNVVGLLYDNLTRHKLHPFLDSKTMNPGDKLFDNIDSAIRNCKIGVAVFSPRYCESHFCLHELATLMESKKKVIPIFVDIKPSELHVMDFNGRFEVKELQRFRRALKEAKYTVGLTFDSSNGMLESIAGDSNEPINDCKVGNTMDGDSVDEEEINEIIRDNDEFHTLNREKSTTCEPMVGMESDSIDAVKKIYDVYAKSEGFSIRMNHSYYSKDRRLVGQDFVCSREANLEEEVQKIAHLRFLYPVIAMDTEFPGVVYCPNTSTAFHHQLDPFNHYRILKANVDALNLIQVSLTLSDAHGNLANLGDGFYSIWEFNLGNFDVDRDLLAPESIQLLKQQGINFNMNREKGICAARFGQLLLKYRIIYYFFMVIWVTFHSSYDFAYLIKILTQRELPSVLPAFLGLVEFFFGMRVYDMKHIVQYCDGLYGVLDHIAETL